MHTGEPQRGDVVVFDHPGQPYPLVKRVIGLPGDTIEIQDDYVYLNGHRLDYEGLGNTEHARLFTEELPGHPHSIMLSPGRPSRRFFGPITIGDGELLVLGDNRDNSLDSRYIGLVARTELRGKAVGNVFSVNPDSWAPRFDRFVSPLK